MSIYATNAIRNYFLSEGCTYDISDLMQTAILSLETSYPQSFQTSGPQNVSAGMTLIRPIMDLLPAETSVEYKTQVYNLYVMMMKGLRHWVMSEGMLEFVGVVGPADVI